MAVTRGSNDNPDSKNKSSDNSNNNKTSPAESQSQNATAPTTSAEDIKPAASNAPLAPPPKPNTNGETPDYFNNAAQNNSHFSLEPNPFEQSFGNPATETPGKFGGLPPVASLTSPAPLGASGTPNWQNSLRSGPLSPAMLPGPTGGSDYFNQEFRGSFPTPNESSLRTGLTPGGGGSMFPAPSPNSQSIFNSMQSGGATPGTLDFHRTALAAAARTKGDTSQNGQGAVKSEYQPAQQPQSDPFNNQPAESDAVNSLYLLSNAGNRNANQFAVPNQPQSSMAQQQQQQQQQQRMGGQDIGHQRNGKQSIGSIGSGTGDDFDMSDNQDKSARSKGKKGGAANGRRKADDTPSKAPATKRAKGNNGKHQDMMGEDMDDSEDDKEDVGGNANGGSKSKMTDEEKRKNFLERNRVAALKCRQRKKQWLAGLQTKVEILTSENDALSVQCTQLREEIVNLKTLLIAHKDCAVSHQQGLGGNAMAQVIGPDFNPHNPYSHMGMNGQAPMMMQGQGMQRR